MTRTDRVTVRTERCEVRTGAGVTTWQRLRRLFDGTELFLYEDVTARPDTGGRLGFGNVLTVTLTGDEVRVTGRPRVVDAVRAVVQEHATPGAGAGATWSVLDAVLELFDAPASPDDFEFGAFCFLGYAATHHAEVVPHRHERPPALPDVSLTVCEGHVSFDCLGRGTVVVYRSPLWEPTHTLEEVAARVAEGARSSAASTGTPTGPGPARDEMSSDDYRERVAACMEFIRAGEAYQIQLGHAISVRDDVAPEIVYAALTQLNPSPFAFLWPVAGTTLVGASPESLLVSRGSTLSMRPIAGTCPRGRSPREDRLAEKRMRADPKELSEHLMLVDLCRNDLARVGVPGTVEVAEYLVVERYSHVAHLVSQVEAQRRSPGTSFGLLRAVFPAGTMTGAPKLRAMEIIDELEVSARGAYAGAVGLVGCGGFLDSALCIRTLVHRDGEYTARASAGVVFESDPEAEWSETLAKMAAPLRALAAAGGTS